MDRIAFISDIHSNLQALTSVLEKISDLDCTEIYCLGDMIGYGARPAECMDLLRGANSRCLTGNHEAMVTGLESGEGFNERSRLAADINRNLLSRETLAYLAELPETIQPHPDVLLCHGSPTSYSQYTYYKIDFTLLSDRMEKAALKRCFLGHTHVPALFDGQELHFQSPGEFQILDDRRYIINPGSVGQPRDKDPRSSFAVWDREAQTINFHRVEYDVQAARQDILKAGLPEQLGERLLIGK